MSVVAILEVTADPLTMRYDLQKEALEGMESGISRYDLAVLEWGKKLAKESGTNLTVIVLGEKPDEALMASLSLVGAARAVLASTPYTAMDAPLQRVKQLASLIQKYSPQVVLCRELQSDGFHSFTGAWMAELLQYTHIGGVEKIAGDKVSGHVTVETMYRKGFKGTYQVALPAVISLTRQETVSYVPRFSQLHLKSRQVPLEKVVFSLEDQPATGRTIVYERLSEVKPRTKTSVPAAQVPAAGSGPGRGNPMAARMKAMMGGAQPEKKQQSTKEVVSGSAQKAAELLRNKLEEWRGER